MSETDQDPHGDMTPSEWMVRFAPLIPVGGLVLDLACGAGRNGRYLRSLGFRLIMLEKNILGIIDMASDEHVEIVATDLEDGRPWPLADRLFDCVVVTNYLHRPILHDIVRSVAPGGVLIYETFAQGNEKFGRPSNPAFLLRPEELLIAARPELRVVAFEDIEISTPRPAAVQRIAAVRE